MRVLLIVGDIFLQNIKIIVHFMYGKGIYKGSMLKLSTEGSAALCFVAIVAKK